MGYDIYSLREDRDKAEAYAKKSRNLWIEEDGSYAATAPSTVYYRMNIWGMGILRELNEQLGVGFLNEYLVDNSGRVIRSWECEDAAETLASKTDEEILEVVKSVVANEEQISGDADEIQAWAKEVRMWQEYLLICSDLKGCEVL
jgi:hypothetical protein